MQILIEIPNPPKKQDIIDIPLHFINGTVCEAGGYGFQVLPPHGRLIDADALFQDLIEHNIPFNNDINSAINVAPTILEDEEL